MILIFDYFETIIHNKSMDFNRGFKPMWEKYYKDRCSFEEMAAYGEELFQHMQEMHKQGLEYAFVKDELPEYAERFGGDVVPMTVEEEADFLMKCNEMENMPYISDALAELEKMEIPMYVLSNSGFTAEALSVVLERLGIRKYFKNIWSSADYGKIKPCKEFFEMAIEQALSDNPSEKREDIVFVGDTYSSDVRGANAAGIDVIWINHKGEGNTDNLPVYDINSTSGLVGAVKTIFSQKNRCMMKKVYLDMTQANMCIGVYVKDAEVIPAGTTVNAMSVKHKNSEYQRFADEYDIHFIFEDNVPSIDFYTIPMVDIFAVDSAGGYIGSVGQATDLQKDIPICYIDADKICYLIAENGEEFLKKVQWWKEQLIPYPDIEFFESFEAAREKYEFLDRGKLEQELL